MRRVGNWRGAREGAASSGTRASPTTFSSTSLQRLSSSCSKEVRCPLGPGAHSHSPFHQQAPSKRLSRQSPWAYVPTLTHPHIPTCHMPHKSAPAPQGQTPGSLAKRAEKRKKTRRDHIALEIFLAHRARVVCCRQPSLRRSDLRV